MRQWPGNVADLEFRGVLAGCDAAIVAAAPIDGTLLQGDEEKSMAYPPANAAFLKSDEYKEVAKVLPFCRLWCVVEMAEVLALEKPLVFECGKVQVLARSRWSLQGDLKAKRQEVEVVRGDEAFDMLTNCSHLVDVAAAQCAVPADKERELAAIGPANHGRINHTVAAALVAGATAVRDHVSEVDAFNCGEPGPLRALTADRVPAVFAAACAAGQLAVLVELRRAHNETVTAYLAGEGGRGDGGWYPLWVAALDGRREVVAWLVGEVGAAAGAADPSDGASAMFVAAQEGHLEVVLVLVAGGASVDQADVGGATPLIMAATEGHLAMVRALVGAGASVDRPKKDGATPLFMAAQFGHLAVVRALVEAGAGVDRAIDNGFTPLFKAAQKGHLEVVRALVEAGADKKVETQWGTPLAIAVSKGHLSVVKLLSSSSVVRG